MTEDEPDERTREAVGVALDETDVQRWFDAWKAASGTARQRMSSDILISAISRNHAEPERRRVLLEFRAMTETDEPERGAPR